MAVPPAGRWRGLRVLAWPQPRVSRASCPAAAGSSRVCHSACPASVPGVRAGCEVEHRPQLGQPVQDVQAQRVLVPAVAEAGRQVPVAGPVHVLDPGRAASRSPPRGPARRASRTAGRAAAGSPPPRRRGRDLVGRAARSATCRPGRSRAARASAWRSRVAFTSSTSPVSAAMRSPVSAGGGGLRGGPGRPASRCARRAGAARRSGLLARLRPGHRRQLHG